MRYLFAVLALLMALFVAVQYNDPDGPVWMVFYGVPAIWAGLAAFRPQLLARTASRMLLAVSLLAGLVLLVVLWPSAEGWWRMDVWWHDEPSREGMGLMLATAVLLAVLAKAMFGRGGASVRTH